MSTFLEKHKIYIVGFLLLSLFLFQLLSSIQESQTTDEGVHLAAGYSYLMKKDFRMNTEHPPLIKELSALPLALLGNKVSSPFEFPSWSNHDEWRFAHDFIYSNTLPADTIILLGRIPVMLLSILLGLYVFRWTNELFGLKSALLGLLLYCFSPHIIAHGHYITTDLGVTAFYFITLYYLYAYFKTGLVRHVVFSGIFLGLAEASKFNAIILLPIIILLLIGAKYISRYFNIPSKIKVIPATLILFGLCFVIVFCTYFGSFDRPANDFNVAKLYSQMNDILKNNDYTGVHPLAKKVISFADPHTVSGKYLLTTTQTVILPAYPYINGFIKLYLHNYTGHTSYLFGKYSDFGWWYYFPVAYLSKTPVTELALLLFSVLVLILLSRKKEFLMNNYLWLITAIFPPALYFAWSMTGHINLGVRHVLIIEPFVILLITFLFSRVLATKKVYLRLIIISLLVFQLYSVIKIFPNYIAYFNEFAGGPVNGYKILVDSNLDWGQDAKKLKKYMVENNIDHVCISYFGQASLEFYGIDYRYLPDNANIRNAPDLECVVAISMTSLYSRAREYGWLLKYQPTARIGYSINIYDFRQTQVEF